MFKRMNDPAVKLATKSSEEGAFVALETLIKLKAQALTLSLKTKNKSYASLAGVYASPFRGRGIDFDEVRMYQPGDDIRSIDWRVTARTGRVHTKLFTEERERPVFFAVDKSSSMQFGSRVAFKSVIAAKVTSILAWAAVSNGDRVGGLVYTETKSLEVKPYAGSQGVLRLLKTMVDIPTGEIPDDQTQSFLSITIPRLRRVAKPGSLVFILSDFKALDKDVEKYLIQLARHCDVVCIFIYDSLESDLPAPGYYNLSDGQSFALMDTTQTTLVKAYKKRFVERKHHFLSFCKKSAIHSMLLRTDDDILKVMEENLIRQHAFSRVFG